VPKVHLGETVIALHKYNRKHQLKVLTLLTFSSQCIYDTRCQTCSCETVSVCEVVWTYRSLL